MGYVFYHQEPFWCSDSSFIINLKSDLITKHSLLCIFYVLKQKEEKIKSYRIGTSNPGLQIEVIQNLKIFLPSLPEQTKITHFFSLLDQRLQSQTKIVKALNLQKTYFLNQLLNQKIRFKAFTDRWQEVKLKTVITEMIKGFTPKKYTNQGIRIIKSGQVRGFDEFNLTKFYYCITCPQPKILQKGDILINSAGKGTAGRVGYWSTADSCATVDSCVTIVRTNSNFMIARFLLYFLSGFYGFKTLENMAVGSTGQIALAKNTLENLKIFLPSLPEQTKITHFFSLLDQNITLHTNLLNYYQHQKSYFLTALLK